MALFKLTRDVWWGDQLAVETTEPIRAWIGLANNSHLPSEHSLNPYHFLTRQPEPPMCFWLPIDDDTPFGGSHKKVLLNALEAIDEEKLYPLLITCVAGMHRSPSTAILAALKQAGPVADGTLDPVLYHKLLVKQLALFPKVHLRPYAAELHAWIRRNMRLTPELPEIPSWEGHKKEHGWKTPYP